MCCFEEQVVCRQALGPFNGDDDLSDEILVRLTFSTPSTRNLEKELPARYTSLQTVASQFNSDNNNPIEFLDSDAESEEESRQPVGHFKSPKSKNNKISTPLPRKCKKRCVKPIKITILGDSVTKYVNTKSLSKELGASVHKDSKVYTFDTASSLVPTIDSDIVLVHIGTNHIKQEPADQTIKKLRILEEKLAKNKQVKQVIVSNIVGRCGTYEKRRKLVNAALEITADRQGWTYLNNRDISSDELSSDNVHLNRNGVNILYRNFFDSLTCVTLLISNLSHFQKIKHIEIL